MHARLVDALGRVGRRRRLADARKASLSEVSVASCGSAASEGSEGSVVREAAAPEGRVERPAAGVAAPPAARPAAPALGRRVSARVEMFEEVGSGSSESEAGGGGGGGGGDGENLAVVVVKAQAAAACSVGSVLCGGELLRYARGVWSGMPVQICVEGGAVVGVGQALMPGELIAGAGGGIDRCMDASPCVLVTGR